MEPVVLMSGETVMSRRTLSTAVLVWGVALGATAAMIVPPADLGELAATSRAVVLARAVGSWSAPGPYVPHTVTRFARAVLVAGEDPGESFEVSVPGGEMDGLAAVVPGAPVFRQGGVYLLFLARGGDGLWRVRMMAYGVLEEVREAGEVLLRPVAEREQVGRIRRFDVEVPGVYLERPLLAHLGRVARGEAAWEARRVLAPPELVRASTLKSAPSGCAFMTYSDGYGIRWFSFDSGGSATIQATTPGQSGISDGGTGAVSGGAAAWTDDAGSLIDLRYGGTTAQSISCAGSGTHYQAGAVVFDDPCGDIDPLSNCSGTLAYGGPLFYTSTQTFDGEPWHPATDLFVVVNDGSECVGETNFSEFVTHELGHGLGFGHHTDPDATMYAYCCHYPRGAGLGATDSTCAAYLYPDAGASPPPAAPTGLAATAVSDTRIDLAWSDASTDEDGFKVYRSTGGGFQLAATVGSGVTSYADTSLSPCVTASYYVTAYNANGESAASNTASATTTGQAPAAPGGLSAQAPDPTRVVLAWENGPVEQDAVWVERATGGSGFGSLATLGGSATSYEDRGVEPGTTYRYRLRAANDCGSSPYSDEVAVTVPSDQEPLQVDFSWDPVAPWAGEEVRFSASVEGGPDTLSWQFGDGSVAEGETVTHRFLEPGTYTVRLTAVRGPESVSATRGVTAAAPPELVAASARTTGLNGTIWRTDMVLLAGGSRASGRVVLYGPGGSELGSVPYDLAGGEMMTLEDVVGTMGLTGTGSLLVEPHMGPPPVVMTRTYTGGEDGTYGQAIPPQSLAHSGSVAITGLRGVPGFRTNFGLASASSSQEQVGVTLHTPGGTIAGPVLTLAPHQQAQWPLESLFGGPVLEGVAAATLEVECSGPVAAYASVVDDESGDPVFLPGEAVGDAWLIPVLGRGPGEAGTWWDTGLVLYNASDSQADVALEYLPAGTTNAAGGPVVHLGLAPRETRRIDSAQAALWGVDSGLGSARVTSSQPLAVAVRVATPRPGGGGSMGQRIPALPNDVAALGQSRLPWVRWDQAFRTNLGLFNTTVSARTVTLELHRPDGWLAATAVVTVPPGSLVQRSQEQLFGPDGGAPLGWIELAEDTPGLVLYASQVDNRSGDPVYVPGE